MQTITKSARVQRPACLASETAWRACSQVSDMLRAVVQIGLPVPDVALVAARLVANVLHDLPTVATAHPLLGKLVARATETATAGRTGRRLTDTERRELRCLTRHAAKLAVRDRLAIASAVASLGELLLARDAWTVEQVARSLPGEVLDAWHYATQTPGGDAYEWAKDNRVDDDAVIRGDAAQNMAGTVRAGLPWRTLAAHLADLDWNAV